MKIVSTTYELEHGAYIYRLIEDSSGVIVRRVPIDNQLWSHGVISQVMNEFMVFKSSCAVGKMGRIHNLVDSVEFIKGH